MLDALGLFDGLSLPLNIDRGVTVGRGDAGVAQPLADREYVDTRPQQMYRDAVAQCCEGEGACLRAWVSQLERVRNVSSKYSEHRTVRGWRHRDYGTVGH